MPKRVELPRELAARPFTVSEARSLGVGEGRMRGADLERPFHGVRARDGELDSVLGFCRAYAPLLGPDRCFSHLTAAELWGCPLPDRGNGEVGLHVTAIAPSRAPRGRGVVGHRLPTASCAVVTRYGLPVADPASTFVQLAPILSLDDLVAIGDHLVLDPPVLDPYDLRPHARLEELTARVASATGRGARAAASALALVRLGAESRRETLLRLLLLRAGLPEPELNPDLHDHEGRRIGRFDIVYREWRVVVEYDGDQHRTSTAQYEKDIARTEALTAAGWIVVKVRHRGLFVVPEATVSRVRAALAQHGWRG